MSAGKRATGDSVGDADLASLGAVLSVPARAKVLLALADGRALPASVLAAEAGVSASTISTHLARLSDAGLVTVRPQGRHRYYALAGPQVGELIETLAQLAPPAPVRSLRDGARAQAIRRARTCYDHVAGQLGVALFAALIAQHLIDGGDGRHHPEQVIQDRLASYGKDQHYWLTADGYSRLGGLGVKLPVPDADGRVPLRYCIDWTEQAHHLSGVVGRELTARLFDMGWIRRMPRSRAILVTDLGERGLSDHLAVQLAQM